eukprot:Plantae.Rhodophyta-Purpureofilum_apyrenoidigerum.ctg43959.p1 GENE.Plantae.Rhodophyta-Purpureofilum_apyrenoidigerum.ctg43959~~Plantae.Rhodophyta-Purpureofilum_apyrenoidigerum.ctg43959.p1  ORF type:complete len:339 (-),score=27.92 Plantae.Rhodophyta-Purpureofilum_apyrenoidigerum.ctg43959:261-1178(-)
MTGLGTWVVVFVVLAGTTIVVSGVVVGSEGNRCQHVQLILHPASVVPAYTVGEGVPIPAITYGELLPDGAPQELCEISVHERTLSSNLMDFFVIAGDRGGCPLSEMQHKAASLGATGLLLVRLDTSVRRSRAQYAFDSASVPFATVPSRDWKEMVQCKSARISFMVLNQEMLNMSLGLFFHWTMLRCVICWFALQAIVCFAARLQRNGTLRQVAGYVAVRRADAIKRLNSITFHRSLDDKYETDMCVICLEDLLDGDMCHKLPCSHVYHSQCLDSWLIKSNECPLCKQALPLLESLPVAPCYGAV